MFRSDFKCRCNAPCGPGPDDTEKDAAEVTAAAEASSDEGATVERLEDRSHIDTVRASILLYKSNRHACIR